MKNKIKVIKGSVPKYIRDRLQEYTTEEKPVNYDVPDGEYLVRGNTKGFGKTYLVVDNKWFLASKTNQRCLLIESGTFNLFPNLSEKEWELMNKIPKKRLNKYWQRALYGYNSSVKFRKTYRMYKLEFIRFKKKKEDIQTNDIGKNNKIL